MHNIQIESNITECAINFKSTFNNFSCSIYDCSPKKKREEKENEK